VKIAYKILFVLAIIAGAHLVLVNPFGEISAWGRMSLLICIAAPLATVVMYIIICAKRRFLGLNMRDFVTERIAIFVISSMFLMFYASPFRRNAENRYIIGLLGPAMLVGLLFALNRKLTKPNKGFPKAVKFVCRVAIGALFLSQAFLSINFAFDTTTPDITIRIIIRTERGERAYWVTVADDAGCEIRLRTSRTVFLHSRENIGKTILFLERGGALGISHRYLMISDEHQ